MPEGKTRSSGLLPSWHVQSTGSLSYQTVVKEVEFYFKIRLLCQVTKSNFDPVALTHI